ncbi:transporter [Hyphomicrobium sp.]|uniref:transporter n=1 Tax=Hyphomicrobium sp. TaxID=82 RepID=UPI0025B89EA6|nr:transporter [Hyphomicrobium sp.]MCC7253812.1 transporter [Hyphomicrobium sp.]
MNHCTSALPFTLSVMLVALWNTPAAAADRSKSGYTLFNPTPDSQLRDMSTDRPDKTESPYTVDAGWLQVETDLVAYTRDSLDGSTTRTIDVMPVNLKIGLTSSTDLQIVYGAYSHARTSGGGATEEESSFGDLVLRVKHNLWGNDGGQTALAVMPFLKVPTNNAASLNDELEGGVIVPLAVDLGHGMGLGLMAQVDILKSKSGSGYEPTFIGSAALGFELTERWGMYVEAFVERGTEGGAETVVTLDGGFTYAVTDHLQLDVGTNVGVTEAADDVTVFAGMSQRF